MTLRPQPAGSGDPTPAAPDPASDDEPETLLVEDPEVRPTRRQGFPPALIPGATRGRRRVELVGGDTVGSSGP